MLYKILVVDDEYDTLKTLKVRLETSGYEVVSTISGEECLEKAAEEKPDLILLDVLLSGLDGFKICELLKGNAKTKDIPVVMLTALIGESARERGLESGAKYLISKPYDPADLLWIIEDALKK